jgi:GT2 family glycosyltransferase
MRKDISVSIAPSPFANSAVDIIVPFHGEYNQLVRLVESILLMTRSNPYQICLVDDGSPNEHYYKRFVGINKIKTVRLDKHQGFGAAVNAGLAETQNPWVILLNSDCEIKHHNWMLEMGNSLLRLKSRNVRMVSARSNNPGPNAPQFLKSPQPDPKADLILPDNQFLPLYCVMCHRGLFKKIGGLQEYPIWGYEDEELSHRMRAYGYFQGICGSSWIYHEGECTIKSLLIKDKKIEGIIEANRERCLEDIRSLHIGRKL